MFGLKLKSWMEAHLGRPHRQKSTSSGSGVTTNTTGNNPPGACSAVSSQLKRAGAPKDIPGNNSSGSNSGSNSTTSSSNCSTTTAIGVGAGSLVASSTPGNFVQSSSVLKIIPDTATAAPGSEEGSVSADKTQEGKIGKSCEKVESNTASCGRVATVSTSVSNSTSILSGGSSFCNSLSSPDTGYSTDGYSPKSVYPALSFSSTEGTGNPKLLCNSSKSSYTISSLVSSTGESKHTSASCSVQDGLDEQSPSPAALLTSSQSSSSGISDSGSSGAPPCPHGLHQHNHHSIPENDSVPPTNQVIMGVDGDEPRDKKSIQLELEKTGASVKATVTDTSLPSSKFSPFTIDFVKRAGNNGNEGDSKPCRTHRRAESMDARTPSHEDYKPLVNGDEDDGNSSSNFMTSAKSIRTSFVLNPSGQMVEFNSYNAFSICSPRRERTRIKTNPWIIVNKSKGKDEGSGSNKSEGNNKTSHANAAQDGSMKSESRRSDGGGGGNKDENPLELEEDKSQGLPAGSKRVNLEEINNKKNSVVGEENNFTEDETGIGDHDSCSERSTVLYRISSTSDSGKGSLVDPETNRNSTESSCLLSEDSTRNSIISQEVSGTSSCARSSSGESFSHQIPEEVETGHVTMPAAPSHDPGQRTFRNASVATTDLPVVVKSCSVSVGVGTTGSNKSTGKSKNPLMVDKETDILSDWATNTDVDDTEDDLETDREADGENNDDNGTVTPAPSSPGTDIDRGLFSQSSSGTTDIDFGDSSAATQASSTQVFPPSSLIRQSHQRRNNSSSGYANTTSNNGIRFHDNSSNNNSESCVENYEHHYHLQQQRQNNTINVNVGNGHSYPAVIPIVRPVLAAQAQHHNIPDNGPFSFEFQHHQPHHPHPFQPFYPNYPEDDLLEDDYPQVKPSSNKGLARGALGFLRKIFKKGACSSQRRSPESLASSAVGKKNKGRGKSDNNLTSLGIGSPLLTIAEPLSNPRYSAAVLTSKKQINPALTGCYFLTPTPNSFRRKSGGGGGMSEFANTSGSDSKTSSSTSKNHSKSVKTDIIRLPQGTLSPQQSVLLPATVSSHSSGSSSSCSGLSISNNSGGMQQQCSTFLPHAAPVIASSFFPGGSTNANLVATITHQSDSGNITKNSSSASSSIHSLMSTSTCSGNRPPSQQQITKPVQNLYSNSSSQNLITSAGAATTSRHSNNPFAISNPNNNMSARSPPPPPSSASIPENSFIGKNPRRDFPQQSHKNLIPYESSSPRLGSCSSSAVPQPHINNPSFNNSYSPIHRLVVTGGNHLRNGNPGESPLPNHRFTDNNSNNFATQVINRSHHPPSVSQSPLINHRSSPHPSAATTTGSQQPTHFFASPSPILRNPRYQYITSSNQNSPVLNGTKRLNSSGGVAGATGPNGPPPLLTTFTPLPSSSSSCSSSQRESLINNNSNANTNTITIGGSVNSNPVAVQSSSSRQLVSSSLSYNEFENLSRQQNFFGNNNGGNNGTSHAVPQQQLLHQSHHKTHHLQQNHYYSSPIVKQRAAEQQQREQTLWNDNEGGGVQPRGGMRQYQNIQQNNQTFQNHQTFQNLQQHQNGNSRFNSFLVRHRQLPQFYHTQWGLQERIYETVDSEDERNSPGREFAEMVEQVGMVTSASSYNFPRGVMSQSARMKHSFSHREGGFLSECNQLNGDGDLSMEMGEGVGGPTKRSKPKTLSASGKPFPRPVVALPMMPAGTFLSETETRLLEADKASDRKYKRLINEAEALLKEISVEKEKRAAVAAAVAATGGPQRDNKAFRMEDCPQSDPLRRKAYDCWALRRLQQELAGCCASPPVLHRSRLNLQSPSTPTMANNPYLSHFQNMGMAPPMLPQQVPYMTSGNVDPNQNGFDF